MKTTTKGQHPNKIFFLDLLAYPKLLAIFSFFLLITILYTAYLLSRPELFVEGNANVTGVEFHRGKIKAEKDSINVTYQYSYKNLIYKSDDTYYLPKTYSEKDVNEYVLMWNKNRDNSSQIKILVNVWYPGFSGFEVTSKNWFVSFAIYYLVYYWFFPILIFTLTSMTIKYFFIRTKNDV